MTATAGNRTRDQQAHKTHRSDIPPQTRRGRIQEIFAIRGNRLCKRKDNAILETSFVTSSMPLALY